MASWAKYWCILSCTPREVNLMLILLVGTRGHEKRVRGQGHRAPRRRGRRHLESATAPRGGGVKTPVTPSSSRALPRTRTSAGPGPGPRLRHPRPTPQTALQTALPLCPPAPGRTSPLGRCRDQRDGCARDADQGRRVGVPWEGVFAYGHLSCAAPTRRGEKGRQGTFFLLFFRFCRCLLRWDRCSMEVRFGE
jgi:hypothetical protein